MNIDINTLIVIFYQSYSEAINRDGFVGLKPRQEYIDLFWNKEIAPRVQAKFEDSMKKLKEEQDNGKPKEKKTKKSKAS